MVSPDTAIIASAGADAAVHFWDTATGAANGAPLTGFTTWVNGIAFSPDGATMASAADGGLQLWDVRNRRPLTSPLTDAGVRVFAAAFGSDGLQLAAADEHSVTLYHLDRTSLVRSACRVANRNLTPAEWTSFLGPTVPFAQTCP
jgi:WD40 repeat protein